MIFLTGVAGNIWIDALGGSDAVLRTPSESGHRDWTRHDSQIQGRKNRRPQQGHELHLVHVWRPHAARYVFTLKISVYAHASVRL
jgi:hypothetical protein